MPMENHQTAAPYELKNELARLCLPSSRCDDDQKLAWVNSICVLFLLIGIFGARRGLIAIKPAPPLREIVPIVVEPITLPPQAKVEKTQIPRETKLDATPVAVVIPQAPNIRFSVPTIGSLVTPENLAVAPPLEPMRVKKVPIGSITATGRNGDRPEPPYPLIAKQTGEQGTVVLLLGSDAAGNVVSVNVKQSSGFPVLDRATADFIKRHWRLPAGATTQLFQTTITYQLQF